MIRLQYLLTLVIFLSASYGQLTVSDKIHNQIQERENASAIMKNSQATKNYYAYISAGGKKVYIRKIFPSDKTRKFSSFYIKYEKQKETFSYIKYGNAPSRHGRYKELFTQRNSRLMRNNICEH